MKEVLYLPDAVTLEWSTETCIHCGMCSLVCPHAVFEHSGKKTSLVHRERCMECGACSLNCPVEAISVVAGVGCASAVIRGTFSSSSSASCDCCCSVDKK